MDHSALLIMAAAIGLFVVASVMKAVLGLAFRFLVFVGLSVATWQMQLGTRDLDYTDPQLLVGFGICAAISFGITLALMATVARKVPVKLLVVPVLGFFVTFAVVAVWTNNGA